MQTDSVKEMRHKKTSRGTAGGNIDLPNSTSGFKVDSGILCEILSRLPVKSLVRFKCVCKDWQFLIQEDSYFINLHFNQSQKHPILLFIPDTDEHPHGFLQEGMIQHESPYEKVELVTIDLMLEGKGRTASLDTTRKMEIPEENVSFCAPVNGLICCHLIRKHHGICICNISTQEISPWIKSNVLIDVQGKEIRTRRIPCYELGFDPATKKHKVICALGIHDPKRSLCEVLTVGDYEWRRIENTPIELGLEYHRRKHTVYLNGFIYYCTSTFLEAEEVGNDKIVAFDVGAEKFRVITVPEYILNQPRYFHWNGKSSNRLIVLKGCLELLIKMNDSTAKLWVFDDVHGSNKDKNISTI
ncbi:F-box protein At1g30790-like [Papaver somniferum]|uniref:F-box protein At1g30790-like n=1 Tax=Papaver somniferum TaxID=3469 RepID=UPI000E6F983C|nr:F-box protein At1g30790-like [Papaver somniferum]